MPFIIESIVSTEGSDGRVNFAPMGVVWEPPQLTLRPYMDTTTLRNLRVTREAVINLTDNVLHFAHSALTDLALPGHPSHHVRGAILEDACAYYGVAVDAVTEQGDRARVPCHIVEEQWLRPFLGFNRARSAVIEAIILATRLRWLSRDDVSRELQRLAQIVDKTGGAPEHEALAFVDRHVCRWLASPEATRDG